MGAALLPVALSYDLSSGIAFFGESDINKVNYQHQLEMIVKTIIYLKRFEPQIAYIGILDPQVNPDSMISKLQHLAITRKTEKLLLATTLLSPDGSGRPYPSGRGKHTVGMSVDLTKNPTEVFFMDPLGLPPSKAFQVAILQAFPGAKIDFLQEKQQLFGLFCANWTCANLFAIATNRPLPKHTDLAKILNEQKDMCMEKVKCH